MSSKSSCNTDLTCDRGQPRLGGPGEQRHQSYHVNCVPTIQKVLHRLKLELPSVKDFSVFRTVDFHGFVASRTRRSKTRSSPEEVPWHSIFWHISCWATVACRLRRKGGSWSTGPPRLLEVVSLFSPPSLDPPHPAPPRRFGSAARQGTTTTQLCSLKTRLMKSSGWSIWTCFRAQLLLVLELT